MVRILPFHGSDAGSNPVGSTKRDVSRVGSQCRPVTAKVTGSSPVRPANYLLVQPAHDVDGDYSGE